MPVKTFILNLNDSGLEESKKKFDKDVNHFCMTKDDVLITDNIIQGIHQGRTTILPKLIRTVTFNPGNRIEVRG